MFLSPLALQTLSTGPGTLNRISIAYSVKIFPQITNTLVPSVRKCSSHPPNDRSLLFVFGYSLFQASQVSQSSLNFVVKIVIHLIGILG